MRALLLLDAFRQLEREAPSTLGLTIGSPLVKAALKEIDNQEAVDMNDDGPYHCSECSSPKRSKLFPTLSALLVHLLLCPRFRKLTESAGHAAPDPFFPVV